MKKNWEYFINNIALCYNIYHHKYKSVKDNVHVQVNLKKSKFLSRRIRKFATIGTRLKFLFEK